MPQDNIMVRGAREHNLKNIDVMIPRDKLVVITGLSGSGKSSLAFDTIFAEGQRRYLESLSAYARNFVGQMEKPDVDHIDGLSPAISIDQKSTSHNPRSTVGTVTEVYDYLRLLYARAGHPHCPNCGREVSQQTPQQMVDAILDLPEGTRLMLLAPLVRSRKGEYRQLFEDLRKSGYVRVRVNGQIRDVNEEIELDRYKQHTIEVVIDRLIVRHASAADQDEGEANESADEATEDESRLRFVAERRSLYDVRPLEAIDEADQAAPTPLRTAAKRDKSFRQRVADSVETALKQGNGTLLVSVIDGEERLYSEKFACVYCGISIDEIAPRTFSFNSPHGACPECTGLGTKQEIDEELIVTNPNLSLAEGAILPWSKFGSTSTWYSSQLEAIANQFGFSLKTPWKNLTPEQRKAILHGTSKEVTFTYENRQGQRRTHQRVFEGVIPNLERRFQESSSESMREEIGQYMSDRPCPVCKGARLKPAALAVTVGGYNVVDVCQLPINQALQFFLELEGSEQETMLQSKWSAGEANGTNGHRTGEANGTISATPKGAAGKNGANGTGLQAHPSPLSERERIIGRQILKEIKARLGFLVDVGLDYLTLWRSATTLSGGEAQRIRLATQIGSSLMGVLYILDEPSIGLHQRDNARLIRTLLRLRDLGNTLLVVEHDEEMMRSSDHIIDIGPGAGEHGGYVVAAGPIETIMATPDSITGQYLSGQKCIDTPTRRRDGNGKSLVIRGARENNLRHIDVTIPLGKFVAITGVSGSGKSSLINEILYKRLAQHIYRAHDKPGAHDDIEGIEQLDKVINIDQSPIGRTPRSNPATYTGAFTTIREIFAQVPEARARGYQAGRFSFNVKGGRCEACQGGGIIQIEMQFLPDVYVACEVCKGRRYNRETLEIHYKGKTISEVLDMTVEEALHFFEHIPSIHNKLATLNDVGLGYIHLGQPATTLSGGEAQRIKLATELSRRATGRTLYILDEPTTGLHFADVARLLDVLQRLVDLGNSVVVIEHNLDVIKSADWLIDLGPEGGNGGGLVIAEGTPEEVARMEQSFTGQFLTHVLDQAQPITSEAR
ncbi:MAG TPA: excinuclease ABC subunit UvrA [Ktedonobacterales bacterium]|nr:excinuclease ABC subunit UvrA [Ktedonobacterales bacterium]